MKRYLKLLSLFGLLFLLVVPLFNSKEASADANTFCAKSFGQVDSGDFEDNYLGSGKDGGMFYRSFSPKFNLNNPILHVGGHTINLRMRCNGKITKKDEPSDSPYRYWFWLKANKKATNSLHWSTVGYTGTLDKVPSPENAYHYSNCARVSRLEASAHSNSFFKSIGKTLYSGGDPYELCLYVVDIKDWYNKLGGKNGYSGFVYLQSITKIFDGSTAKTGELTTINEWKDAATARGFNPDGLKTYWKHYNQRINLNIKTYREFKVHKIATTSKHPILGDYSSLGRLHGVKWKTAKPSSIIKFSNIRGHVEKDGTKYYLKGIVVRGPGTRKKVGTDHGHFYILDNYNDNPICGTTKLTTKYSHQNSKYSGSERDSLSSMKYVYDNVINISYDDDKFKMSRSDTCNPEKVHTNKSGKTGGHSWETLSKHIQDLYVKIPEDKSEIFLIYQKIPQGDVYARKHYRDWSDKDNDYKEVDTTKYKEIDKLPKGKTKCSYSIAKAAEKDSKAVSPVSTHADIPYYARKIKMTYTPAGKTKPKDITIDTNDYLKGSGLDSPFWSGKDSEKAALKAFIEKVMKNVKADDVNCLADVKFDIYYYQPKTPTVGLMYYQYYNDKGQAAYTLVGATETKCVHPGSTKKSRYGSIKFENSIRVGKVDGKYVRVTDANQALATEVETVDLTSAKAYLTTVKGYLGEKKNGWGNDRPLTSGALKSKKAGNTLEFNTQFNGNAAVFIYRNPTAALTVNIYSGTTMGDASKNPPSTCDVPKDSFDWTLAETYDKEIDASKEDEEKRTFRVKEFRTLKEMGADKTASSELYGFIKDFTDVDDPDGVIKSGPPKDDTKDGDNYVTTAVWEKDSKSHVVLNLYYVRFIQGSTVTPSPSPSPTPSKPTPTPSKPTPTPPDGGDGDHTQVTWDDIPNGMGSEWKEHGSGPLIETKSSNCKIEGVVEKDEVETVMDSTGVLRYGLEGETIIPNGYRDWDNGGKYHANKLKSEIRNTAYLSRGGIKKHNKSYSFTVHMSRTIVFVIPPSTPYGSPSYVSRLQKVDMGVTVQTVYFELLRAEVWEPTKAKTFNYAFPNSTTGDNVKIDVDGECRVPVKQLFAAAGKDYFVKLAKQAPGWGNVGKAENQWHKYEVNTAALSNLFYSLPTIEIGVGSYEDIPESVDGIRLGDFVRFLANVTPGIVESNFKVASDVLEFIHPNWEVGKAGQKDVILWKTMYGHKATGPFGTLYIGPENYDKLNALNNLRIPLSKMSTDGLFKVSGIRVDQSKLNSKLVQDGPDNASRVAVRYSITPMCLGSGSPTNGWFYSNTCHKVTLHTPVALNVKIKKYTRERVQSQRMFTEDDGEPLTLGTPFEIELTYKGDFDNVDYGKKLDTRPYLMEDDTAYFTFPFPVFVKDKSEKVEYHEKDIQFKQTDVSKCKFYAAYWALEDRHVFTTDVDALNAVGQDKMIKSLYNVYSRKGVYAR